MKAITLEVIAVTRITDGVERVILTETDDYLKINLVIWTFTHIKHIGQYRVGDVVGFSMHNHTHPDQDT